MGRGRRGSSLCSQTGSSQPESSGRPEGGIGHGGLHRQVNPESLRQPRPRREPRPGPETCAEQTAQGGLGSSLPPLTSLLLILTALLPPTPAAQPQAALELMLGLLARGPLFYSSTMIFI